MSEATPLLLRLCTVRRPAIAMRAHSKAVIAWESAVVEVEALERLLGYGNF